MDSTDSHGNHLIEALLQREADPTVAVLDLGGLYSIQCKVQWRQFSSTDEQARKIQKYLRRWRCESLDGAYTLNGIQETLRDLTIFKTFGVPLFIDNYGDKRLLTSFETVEDIPLQENTPIYHVTHSEEAEQIKSEKQLKPSNNKNIIEGCWFGLDKSPSVYGSKCFETKLSKLGITGLRQGEIVSYKNEVNVILYAADDIEDLKKPTLEAAKKLKNDEAYVKVSIFVPAIFLPSGDKFDQVFDGPTDVYHYPFCVKEKRRFSGNTCKELQGDYFDNECLLTD